MKQSRLISNLFYVIQICNTYMHIFMRLNWLLYVNKLWISLCVHNIMGIVMLFFFHNARFLFKRKCNKNMYVIIIYAVLFNNYTGCYNVPAYTENYRNTIIMKRWYFGVKLQYLQKFQAFMYSENRYRFGLKENVR